MNKCFVLMVAAMVAATAAVRAEAENKPAGKPGPQPERAGQPPGPMRAASLLPHRLVADLALTPEQSAKLKELTAEFEKARADHIAAHKAEMDALREQVKEARAANDEEKVRQLQLKLRELMRPMMELRKSYVDKFRATLTEEQQQKLDRFLAEPRQRVQERRAAAAGKGPKKEN